MTVPVNVLASIAWICVCSRGEAMSRKALLWIFAAACFPLLQSQALAANTSEALVDDFLRKSGLWAQLAQIEPGVQLGIEQGDVQMRQLNDEQLGHLRDAARVAYGADRLRKAMRAELVSAGASPRWKRPRPVRPTPTILKRSRHKPKQPSRRRAGN
jgi:hypothetical protein